MKSALLLVMIFKLGVGQKTYMVNWSSNDEEERD
jgi:hypothetical protein